MSLMRQRVGRRSWRAAWGRRQPGDQADLRELAMAAVSTDAPVIALISEQSDPGVRRVSSGRARPTAGPSGDEFRRRNVRNRVYGAAMTNRLLGVRHD